MSESHLLVVATAMVVIPASSLGAVTLAGPFKAENLDSTQVRVLVEANLDRLEGCVAIPNDTAAAKATKALFPVIFEVSVRGHPESVNAIGDSEQIDGLCIMREIAEWRLPATSAPNGKVRFVIAFDVSAEEKTAERRRLLADFKAFCTAFSEELAKDAASKREPPKEKSREDAFASMFQKNRNAGPPTSRAAVTLLKKGAAVQTKRWIDTVLQTSDESALEIIGKAADSLGTKFDCPLMREWHAKSFGNRSP